MRATAIPAQITTVEDRIVGSLNLGQLMLLCAPVFGGGLLYAIMPPIMTISVYKVVLLALLSLVCGILSLRIKERIVLFWMMILLRYWLRPRYYVFDKRSSYSREQYRHLPEVPAETVQHRSERPVRASSLSLEARAKVEELLTNPAAKVAFETRKGGLYVRITEVRQES